MHRSSESTSISASEDESSDDSSNSSDELLDIAYDDLQQVYLDGAHRIHVATLSSKLGLPFNFISLLELTRVAKICQNGVRLL
jgi:hypothetical protein